MHALIYLAATLYVGLGMNPRLLPLHGLVGLPASALCEMAGLYCGGFWFWLANAVAWFSIGIVAFWKLSATSSSRPPPNADPSA